MFEGKISFKMQYLVCLNGSCLGLHFGLHVVSVSAIFLLTFFICSSFSLIIFLQEFVFWLRTLALSAILLNFSSSAVVAS